MKLRNILYALVLVLASCSAEQGLKDVHVIPEPLEMKVGKSYVSLSEVQLIYRNDDSLPNEAYKISVRGKKIIVKASSDNGFLYARQTVDQLTDEVGRVPCVEIYDAPRFAYRGMHLDVARHFFGVVQVKKYLDIMAIHKMNTFHWHLTDDQGWRVEIKRYPKLTEFGSMRKETAIGNGWYDV